jgi:membrane associated rhomboid family serine protease
MLTALMPIGDDNEGRLITPVVTYALIAINILVFVFLQLPSPNEAFTYAFSVVPREITHNTDLIGTVPLGGNAAIRLGQGPAPIQLTILSAMFMHGSWMHLLGNMLYLWIFGDNVEDAMGHVKFLIFYLVCGVAATFAHILSGPNSLIPSLGASGAIAGVLGGYLLMFPTRSVRVLIGMMGIIQLPALIVVGFWIVTQFISGIGSIARTEQTSGVAYWAHIGGALAGLILVNVFRTRNTQARIEERLSTPTRDLFGGGR